MAIKHALDLGVGDRVHYESHMWEVIEVDRATATDHSEAGKVVLGLEKIENGEKTDSLEEVELEPDFILYTPETE